MFHRIGRVVVKHSVWTIVLWVVAAVVVAVSAPKLPSNSDESSFLPKSYESIQAMDLQEKAFPAAFTPAAEILFQRTDGGKLTVADKAEITKIDSQLSGQKVDQVQAIVAGPFSPDGKYGLTMVKMNKKTVGQDAQSDAAKVLRADAKKFSAGTTLDVKIGGSAAQALDQQDASKKGGALIGIGTFLIIVIAMLLIFRAPLMALLPLLIIGVVAIAANGLIADITKLLNLQSNSSVSDILIVVLFGVGTDYILFLMFRYRERLRMGEDHKEAMVNSVTRVGEAIASAAGAVIISFLALSLSSVSFLKQMGPALAVAVFVTLIAGLTLVPAVFSLIPPRVLFAPSKKWKVEPKGTRFAAIGRTVQRRPGTVAAVSGIALIALALIATTYKASFDFASGSMPKTKESMVVQSTLTDAYSAGTATPTDIYVNSTDGKPVDKAGVAALEQKIKGLPGVASISPVTYNTAGTTADVPVILKYDPASENALNAVDSIRSTAHAATPAGTKALVGGESAIYKDINKAIDHDYRVVFPIAAVLILLILALMLRSLVAPWYLMASVGLGFAATLGSTVLIFQHMKNQQGLIFMLPVFIYMFVVAIGTDYNILMISRLREESRNGNDPRSAVAEAIKHAGPTVAAAGAILAGTFASMLLAGNTIFSEMGFSISWGIVLAAFVMSMFFTPSLTALIGRRAWWPGHGGEAKNGGAHGGSRVVAQSGDGRPELDDVNQY